MRTPFLFLVVFTFFMVLNIGCQKELQCEDCQSAEAVYTFAATDNNCDNNKVYGTYTVGDSLTTEDSVAVQVNVTTTGSYTLQAQQVNGMVFSAQGTFTQLGLQTLLLHGAGTPEKSGPHTISLSNGSSSCGFLVMVDSQEVTPAMYYSFVVDSVVYTSDLDSAHLTYQEVAGARIYSLSFRSRLKTPSDTLFSLGVSRTNTPVTTGMYHAAQSITEDFAGGINFSVNNDFIYGTSRYLPSFKIYLTDYGLADRLVKGTFTGPVMDGGNRTIYITKGKFKTYLKQ